MRPQLTTRRHRELIATTTLAVTLGAMVFLAFLLFLGLTAYGMLATLAVMALIGLGHYLVWGRRAEQEMRGAAGTSVAKWRGDRDRPAGPSRYASGE